MGYLANHIWQVDLIPPSCRWCQNGSVLSYNYYPSEKASWSPSKEINWPNTLRGDYHLVIREKLNSFSRIPAWGNRGNQRASFVDSAPWWSVNGPQKSPESAGLAKKTACCLIGIWGAYSSCRTHIDLWSHPDNPITQDLLWTCTNCIDACPDKCDVAPGVVQWLAMHFLSHRLSWRQIFQASFNGQRKTGLWLWYLPRRMPGIDFQSRHAEPKLNLHPDLKKFPNRDDGNQLRRLSPKVFAKSAVKRTK